MKKVFVLCFGILSLLFVNSFAQAATSWYLPEGSTDSFDFWILVTNPNSSSANITFTFYRSGLATVTATATVDPNNRYSLNVNRVDGIGSSAISTKVECTNGLQIYAERAMYWDTVRFTTWAGGHTARGIAADEGCYFNITSLPMTISTSGTYVLTGDLTNSSTTEDAVTISADDVTINLNGFTLSGNSSATAGSGIIATANRNITIKNGVVRDFAEHGIELSGDEVYAVHVESVTAYNNGSYGIYCAAKGGSVRNCTVDTNAGGGINFWQNGVIRDNTCYNNTHYGIYANINNLVTNNSVYYTLAASGETDSAGIFMRYNNSVINNVVGSSQYDTTVIYGIYVAEDNNFIQGNNVTDCGYVDVWIAAEAIENYVVGNHSSGSDNWASFSFNGTYNYYANNIHDRGIANTGGATNRSGNTTDNALSNINTTDGVAS